MFMCKILTMIYCSICMVSVFIWQTALAVDHVQKVISVTLPVSPIHPDYVKQDFTVQAETQNPPVGKLIFFSRKIFLVESIHPSII